MFNLLFQSICHCLDDRKISGGLGSYVYTIPESQVVVTGTPKTISKISDHNKEITSHFCGDCGSTLWRSGGSQPEGMIGIRAGCIDDPKVADEMKPIMELYVERKPKWLSAVQGAEQRNWKYELIE